MPGATRWTRDAVRRAAERPGDVVPLASTRPTVAPAVTLESLGFTGDERFSDQAAEALSHATRAAQTRPPAVPRFPIGTLRSAYGELEELRRIPIDADYLEAVEPCGTKRPEVLEKYAAWAREGFDPPPIDAVETEHGKVRVQDGHHRLCALRDLGRKTVDAWVALTWKAQPIPHAPGRFVKARGVTPEVARCIVSGKADEECLP